VNTQRSGEDVAASVAGCAPDRRRISWTIR
jgi:hypothetical protein